jgi:hypothetical protein
MTPTYNTWRSMMRRCTTPSATGYESYGGRGIKVCERWTKFESFLADMGTRPDNRTLDRIKVDENYEPSNCRWATKEEQSNNRRNNRAIEFEGRVQTLSMWAKELRLSKQLIRDRLESGLSADEALTKPVRLSSFIEYRGEKKALKELAVISGISYGTLWNRLKAGWNIESAMNAPVNHGNGWKNNEHCAT